MTLIFENLILSYLLLYNF